MKITKYLITAGLALSLVGCGNEAEVSDNNTSIEENDTSSVETTDKEVEKDVASDSNNTVTITDNHGEVVVPRNPEKVVSLDSRTYDVLDKFGVSLVAAPVDVMPESVSYKTDESITNIGNHREPNFELLAAADPDLVIIGQRFEEYYDEIKELLPNASVIDISTDVSEDAESPGNNLLENFINSTTILGEIFEREEEAQNLILDLEESIEKAKNAYNGESVMGVIVSGGEIGYAAPKYGRVWGPLYEILDLKPALEVDKGSSDHMGDDISVEAIAQSKPAYLLVLDRDAAVSSVEDAKPASDVIENSKALTDLDVIKNNKVYYAPNDTYTNESIITYTKIFNGLADLFSK